VYGWIITSSSGVEGRERGESLLPTFSMEGARLGLYIYSLIVYLSVIDKTIIIFNLLQRLFCIFAHAAV